MEKLLETIKDFKSFFTVKIIKRPRFKLVAYFDFDYFMQFAKNNSDCLAGLILDTCKKTPFGKIKDTAGLQLDSYVSLLIDDASCLPEFWDLEFVENNIFKQIDTLRSIFATEPNLFKASSQFRDVFFDHFEIVHCKVRPEMNNNNSVIWENRDYLSPPPLQPPEKGLVTRVLKTLEVLKSLLVLSFQLGTSCWLFPEMKVQGTPPPPKPWIEKLDQINLDDIRFD